LKTQQTRSPLPSTFFIPCSIFDIPFILARPSRCGWPPGARRRGVL
jgi:hypothetical protein